jgi:hypothetical protein
MKTGEPLRPDGCYWSIIGSQRRTAFERLSMTTCSVRRMSHLLPSRGRYEDGADE